VIKSAPSFYANIWIAGDHAQAVQACRQFCLNVPLCVTVTPTTFVYVGGAEDGVCVRLINYPRFPKEPAEIQETATALAEHLRSALCQHSYSIEYPHETVWDTKREQP
jgi:hypothetical protein